MPAPEEPEDAGNPDDLNDDWDFVDGDDWSDDWENDDGLWEDGYDDEWMWQDDDEDDVLLDRTASNVVTVNFYYTEAFKKVSLLGSCGPWLAAIAEQPLAMYELPCD